ncbi:uncharacterized protein LY89DRAFT_683688 [Mollisia scopiformis]|uniref:Uncharacterized protein n=1 Tax=Mollisia scopiformis TaxID=149040 RepID=A0A194XF96_MOLSC|nr:uncharacterized protein LY89DRAFT_683688 [Mollisia scopiformis]KUJ18821.1 hypothetical protein LY89DRAFT_683688 [Mollisia scopiformis]
MPPSLSRSSMSCLSRCRCPNSSIAIRSFTTTPSLTAIGPENPKFIEVPIAPQPQAHPKIDIKGTLPPPRNLFPRRAGNKTSREYLAAVTPEPKHESEPKTELEAWKRRMAATRRTNLREGLVELHKRKRKEDAIIAGRSRARSEAREARLYAPQREDDRLTNPTITAANSTLQTGHLPDPDRAARIAEKAARVEAIATEKEEARRDALHTLYMHARSFITTEEQLDQRIEAIFTDTPFEHNNRNDNIWEVAGAPHTVQDMLSEINKTEKSAVQYHSGPSQITGKRMKKIAEELTGGKMD